MNGNRTVRTQNWLNKREVRDGWRVFPLYCFILPLLFGWLAGALRDKGVRFSSGTMNLLFYLLMAGVVCALFRSFLGKSLQKAFWHPKMIAQGILWGVCADLLLRAMLRPMTHLAENWNTGQFAVQTEHAPLLVLVATVICAPVVEETLFRGLVFGSLRKNHRLLAYGVTTALFCMLHVWQQVLRAGDLHALSLMVEYIAPSVALIFCYEKSGTIWAPILLHAGMNMYALLAVYW